MPASKSIQSKVEAKRVRPLIKSKDQRPKVETTNDRWIGWFRPLEKGTRMGPLLASPILIFREEKRGRGVRKLFGAAKASGVEVPQLISRDLVVSVPGVCGTAVQRNRFKRIVRARFANSILKGFRSEEIDVGQENIASKSPRKTQSRKGLWIRLLNRHRLGQKILTRDWQKIFDAIENQFCS